MNSDANQAKKYKPVFQWVLSCRTAEEFLRSIRPYVHIKGDRIDLALAFQKTMKPVRRIGEAVPDEVYKSRQDFRERLMEMNKRGIA